MTRIETIRRRLNKLMTGHHSVVPIDPEIMIDNYIIDVRYLVNEVERLMALLKAKD